MYGSRPVAAKNSTTTVAKAVSAWTIRIAVVPSSAINP
ncbi:Uncharacterised protein [Mycobacteroides abscessus subsp. abscessus]|nr:Uncharacterised protein [Mycobacteroides abscessus subsp. abscessus]